MASPPTDLCEVVKLCRAAYYNNESGPGIKVLKQKNALIMCARSKSGDRPLHIVARGTDSAEDWKDNIDIVPDLARIEGIKLPTMYFHSGFNEQVHDVLPLLIEYLAEEAEYKKSDKIIFSGHSLGGAMAPILAFYLWHLGYTNQSIITFGAPKFCTFVGLKWFNNTDYVRVVNYGDPVPLLPPGLFYINCENKYIELKNKKYITRQRKNIFTKFDCLGLCSGVCSGDIKDISVDRHNYDEYVAIIEAGQFI